MYSILLLRPPFDVPNAVKLSFERLGIRPARIKVTVIFVCFQFLQRQIITNRVIPSVTSNWLIGHRSPWRATSDTNGLNCILLSSIEFRSQERERANYTRISARDAEDTVNHLNCRSQELTLSSSCFL